MKASVEISLYPLHQDYEQVIIAFIEKLKANPNIRVEVNGLSTQLFGDYDELMDLLKMEIRGVFDENKAMVVMKIGPGTRTPESLPEALQ